MMNHPSTFSKIRLLAIVVTVAILVGHRFLPVKREAIYPASTNDATLYSDDAWGGKTTATWIDPSISHWRCTLVQGELYPVCGVAISFPGATNGTLDFSAYDAVSIRLKYEGKATKLRIYIRNHNPAYSDLTNVDSLKFNSVTLRAADFSKGETTIHLTEFAVADWWLEERDIPRELALPEHNNVASFGIDLPHPQVFGQHDIQLERIELVGAWVSNEQLYLTTIIIWMLILGWETGNRLLLLFRRSRLDSQRIKHLTDYAQVLQKQTDKYKELSTHDALTGALNRNGLAPTVDKLFAKGVENAYGAVLLFDIDHFKHVNDRRGHDAGDRILKGIADVIRANIRENDTLARWGGEEFIIISIGTQADALLQLADKIRTLVAKHTFEPQDPLQVTISIGAAPKRPGDTFEDTFKRADSALYKAKDIGRNCVVLAD